MAWRKNCLEKECWLRSEFTNLMPYNTGHKAEVLDMFGWYWTELDVKEQMWACLGFRVSHDKDNAFNGDAELQEMNPRSGVIYKTEDPAVKMDDETNRIWFTVDIDGQEEGGYLQLKYGNRDDFDLKKCRDPNAKEDDKEEQEKVPLTDDGKCELGEAVSSSKFGYIDREDNFPKGNEAYKPVSDVKFMENGFGEAGGDDNPWVVRDNLWLNGDYDAHLSGTACRLYKGKGKVTNELQWTGDDWDNLYDIRFWYTQFDTEKEDFKKPAKVGSKSSKQMLVLRRANILDPPMSYVGAVRLIVSSALISSAFLLL